MRREYHQGHGIDVHMGLTDSELARTKPLQALPTIQAVLHSLIPNAFGAQVRETIHLLLKIVLNKIKVGWLVQSLKNYF